jgi:hypothetical protein
VEVKDIVKGVSAASNDIADGLYIGYRDLGKQSAGLVDQKGVGCYLAIWRENGHGVPLAVTVDGVQLPSDQPGNFRFIKWDDLYEVVQAHKVPKPQ